MNKISALFLILTCYCGSAQEQLQVITRQGHVSFFSYTSVENIEASNNQVLSIIDLSKNEIAVLVLMKAFIFKKALMEEHFNESYVESDIYPRLEFKGALVDFETIGAEPQTKLIKGVIDFHGVKKEIEFKTKIERVNGPYVLSGDFEINISDYDIKVPALLAPNIAKIIKIIFRFEYGPYEK